MSKEANNLPVNQIVCGDCLEVMRDWPANSVHCCMTSPPYWGLRDYGADGQLGLEKTPEEYVAKMVEVFAEVKRVLRDDGSLWLNLGDSYVSNPSGKAFGGLDNHFRTDERDTLNKPYQGAMTRRPTNLKPKDLCGIPWRVAFALQADGWYLRQDIIWAKPNPMPESVTDRCTKAHEYIFLLTKRPRYFYDAQAIAESAKTQPHNSGYVDGIEYAVGPMNRGGNSQREDPERIWAQNRIKNKRSVWTVNPKAFPEAHFATFPPKLIEPCILAGTSAKGCCPECGGPWERVVETKKPPLRKTVSAGPVGTHGLLGGNRFDEPIQTKTTGWRPTCKCKSDDTDPSGNYALEFNPIPCIVLDPFSGSGTTCLVAAQNGRSYVGVDVNPEYCEMARERLSAVDTGVPVKEARAGQMAMFNEAGQ